MRTTFTEETALNRAARRLEEHAHEQEIEALVAVVRLTPDPDSPGCCLGWEAAYALPEDELRRRFEEDDWRSWELAESDDIEAYESSNAAAETYRRAAEIVREEASA